MEHFYMLVGYPGSGKTKYCEKFDNIDDVEILCHDKLVKEEMNVRGHNKARSFIHKLISEKISNPTKKIIIYDSVNFSYDGRKYFLDLVPKTTNIHIVYFEPSPLIVNGIIDQYVDWLHSVRKDHHIFPLDRKRAIETIENIKKNFVQLQEDEKQYDVIYIKSFKE
jgi:hypothetical protein